MATVVTVRLGDDASVDKAVKQLMEYADRLEEKCKLLSSKLAEIGGNIARMEFAGASSEPVSIDVTATDKGARLEASGYAVFFIEFGTGSKYYGSGHPLAEEVGAGPTTWSLGSQGKGHLKNGKNFWWTPDGEYTQGMPPAKAMYHARNEMITKVTEIAREVFAND